MHDGAQLNDRYRAFISYSHQDKDWGAWLHRALETYRVPKKIVGKATPYGPIPQRLTPIFRDRDELATADNLSEEITAALKASLFLVVICSPAAAKSRWVNEEIKTFKHLHGEGRVRAVIVSGEPFSGDRETECFPESLRFKFDANGEITAERAEPIAADLRPGGDGKKYALSKLVAGLTGARLDELIQREQMRRNSRMRVAAGGFAAVAAGMGAAAVNAVIARDEARAQRAKAIEARDGAEGLVEYMLTDLRNRLDAVGRLDVLDSVGKKALQYYDARDLSAADPDALGRRARAQLLIGEMDNSRGDLDAALRSYTAAAATTQEQLRRDPDNPQRIFDHSQSVFWVGYIAWQRGDAEAAREHFTQYHDQAKRLVEIDPDNDDYQAELEYSYSNLGTLEMDVGKAAQAEQYFRKSLEVSTRLAEKHPDDIERLIAAGQSYAWLADASIRQLKLSQAVDARQAEIANYESMLSTHSDNAALLQRASIAFYSLGQLEVAIGNTKDGLEHAIKATNYGDQLLAIDPQNMYQTDRTSFAYSVRGEAHLHLQQTQEARRYLSKSIILAERLIAQDDSVIEWKATLARAKILLAKIEARNSQNSIAKELLEDVLTELSPSIESGVADPSVIRTYCVALAQRSRLSTELNVAWDEIAILIHPSFENQGLEGKALLAEAFLKTGKKQKAKDIVSALYAAGYRHPDFVALLTANPELLRAPSGDAAPP